MAQPALEVSDVSHAFGARQALDGVSLTVEPGQFAVLLGLNGAGKTTLFSLITRLYNNRSGAIRVLGHDVRKQSGEALRRLGVVFQQRTLDLDLSVLQNLLYHAALHGIPRGAARGHAERELGRVELSERAADKVRKLSGGQLRRVEIARALLHEPAMLLLDEPTVGLDIQSRRTILEHVRALCRDVGLGVLWATHLIDEIGPGDKVIVLHLGHVLAEGPVEQVVADSGAADIRDAFQKLTAGPAPPGGPVKERAA